MTKIDHSDEWRNATAARDKMKTSGDTHLIELARVITDDQLLTLLRCFDEKWYKECGNCGFSAAATKNDKPESRCPQCSSITILCKQP